MSRYNYFLEVSAGLSYHNQASLADGCAPRLRVMKHVVPGKRTRTHACARRQASDSLSCAWTRVSRRTCAPFPWSHFLFPTPCTPSIGATLHLSPPPTFARPAPRAEAVLSARARARRPQLVTWAGLIDVLVGLARHRKVAASALGAVGAQGACCMVQGAGCMVHGAWCMVQGAGCRVQGAWCMVQGAGCMVQGAGCMVHGAWCMVHGAGRRRGAGVGQVTGEQARRIFVDMRAAGVTQKKTLDKWEWEAQVPTPPSSFPY